MDQKFKFGGTIGYGDWYLQFSLLHFKVFRLLAILLNAAGAVRAHSGKRPGYCYLIGRGPTSCLLGHVIELLFCLLVKLFLLSILNFLDFWSSMSCIVLDIELTGMNVVRNWGFKSCEWSAILFSSSKNVQSQKNKLFDVQEVCMELCATVEVWITMSCK